MKLAVGPLTTGIYAVHPVAHEGKYFTAHKNDDGAKLGTVEDKEHQGIKWYVEKVGENRYKVKNINSGHGVLNSGDSETVGLTEGEGTVWMAEPTDVIGEYTGGPADDPSVCLTTTGDEPVLKVELAKSEKPRFKVYRFDDD